MEISRHNKLLRFAFIGSNPFADYPPTQISLCALVQRILWRVLCILVIGGLLVGYTWLLIEALLRDPWRTLTILGAAVGGIAILVAGLFSADHIKHTLRAYNNKAPEDRSAIQEVIYAIKNKVCPIIRIK